MKHLLKTLMIITMLVTFKFSFSQWVTSGNNINNTNTGNVGIGTTTPTRKLDVIGTFGLSNQFNQSSYLANGYNYNARFGGIILQSPLVNNILFQENAVYDGVNSENSHYVFNGPSAAIQISNGNFNFYTGVAGTSGNIIPNWAFLPKVGLNNNGGFAIGSNYAAGSTTGDGILTVSNNVGIGTQNPLAQLHTTGTVRFAGLTLGGTPNNLVSIDANGQLWRSPLSTGVQNNCAVNNFIVKSDPSLSNLTCSQLYDDGTSVGIGVTSGFSYTWPGGLSGTTPPPPTGTLKLAINGVTRALAYFATSDRRYKKNISPLKGALSKIKSLQGVSYLWDKQNHPEMNFNEMPQIGFIAQDVEKIIPEAVIKDDNGYYSMNYSTLIPILNEGIKEQETTIEEMKNEIAELKNEITNLKGQFGIKLKGNYFTVAPNPFNQSTQIKYNLPNNTSNVVCMVYDLQGKILKQIKVPSGNVEGYITLAKDNLANGVYFISLVINNKELQTEKVILAN